MKRIAFFLVSVLGLSLISCSNHSKKTDDTLENNEEDIMCLCCLEEAPEDSIVCDSIK